MKRHRRRWLSITTTRGERTNRTTSTTNATTSEILVTMSVTITLIIVMETARAIAPGATNVGPVLNGTPIIIIIIPGDCLVQDFLNLIVLILSPEFSACLLLLLFHSRFFRIRILDSLIRILVLTQKRCVATFFYFSTGVVWKSNSKPLQSPY